jgi:phospholipid transport system substrate-binding protein
MYSEEYEMRHVTIPALCLGLLLVWAPSAAAASPTDTLRASIDEVLMILRDPGYADPASRPPLRASIERKVRVLFDFTEFSRRTLVDHWKTFSADQQQRFSDAFASLLITTYLGKVDGYNGEKVVYLGERFTQQDRLAVVQTTIALSSGKVVPVAYRMIARDGAWRIYDVLVENVGLNSNYRVQFNEILTREKQSPDQLIARVEAMVLNLSRQTGQGR